jgi:hypothetical protein
MMANALRGEAIAAVPLGTALAQAASAATAKIEASPRNV